MKTPLLTEPPKDMIVETSRWRLLTLKKAKEKRTLVISPSFANLPSSLQTKTHYDLDV
jgi:hypothetical protein